MSNAFAMKKFKASRYTCRLFFGLEGRRNLMESTQDLRCPKCQKKLADLQGSYFDIVDEKTAKQNKGKFFIKCPKCREITEF
jgi:phage FluMu protein Com